MRTLAWTAVWVILLDQVTKYLVVHVLDLQHLMMIPVIPGLLQFNMAWNDGINFGLFAAGSPWTRWLLIGIAALIALAVIFWVWREQPRWIGRVAAGLVVGGALGNMVDRLIYGAVADYINVTCCGINNPYAFNVADIAIFLGVVMLVFLPADKEA